MTANRQRNSRDIMAMTLVENMLMPSNDLLWQLTATSQHEQLPAGKKHVSGLMHGAPFAPVVADNA